MTRYFTKVADELLTAIREGIEPTPEGFRLIREVEVRPEGCTLVEFEDDGAPASMEGCVVCPTFTSSGSRIYEGGPAEPYRVWISGRYVESERP